MRSKTPHMWSVLLVSLGARARGSCIVDKRPMTVLVTGAGGGLGRAIAERLARAGHVVTGTVRCAPRARALEQEAAAAGLSLTYRPLEFPSMAGADPLTEELLSRGGLDVLVNNAGCGVFGAVESVPAEETQRQFGVNLFGPLELTRRLLPALRASRGRIVWMGSLAGRMALPFQAHYSATKAAVAAISDALRMELRPHGVQVVCVEPGDFATGFTDARTVIPSASSVYELAQSRCLSAAERQERGAASPEHVAEVVARLCQARRLPARVPVGSLAGTMCAALRVAPDSVREWTVRRNYGQS